MPLSRHWARMGIGAFAMLLIQGVLMSQPVQAGCNHLVYPIGRDGQPQLPVLAGLEEILTGQADPLGKHHQPPPCSGPSCSGNVPLPLPSSVFEAPIVDNWCMITGPLVLEQQPSRREWVDDDLPALLSSRSRVFHPPRSLA